MYLFLNEHGDLYFLLHNNSEHIILFNEKEKFNKKCIGQEKDIGQRVQKTVLWNANYDHENKDYMNALCLRRLKWCDTNFICYLSVFFPQGLG